MAEGITIPSPSVFLRDSPPPATPKPDPVSKPAKQHVRRPSKEPKKAAPKKGQQPAVATDSGSGIVKPKQSKSRNGCITCKAKRLKCGEEKPKCQQCARRNVECGGYKKDFKWRPFAEGSVKLNIDRQKQATSPNWRLALSAPKPVAPPNAASASIVPPEPRPRSAEQPQDAGSVSPIDGTIFPDGDMNAPASRQSTSTNSPGRIDTPSQDSVHSSPLEDLPDPAPPPDLNGKSRLSMEDNPNYSMSSSSSSQAMICTPTAIRSQGASPTLTEILQPMHDVNPGSQDFVNFSLPEDMQLPLHSSSPENLVAMDENMLIMGADDDMGSVEDLGFDYAFWPGGFENSPFVDCQSSEQSVVLWQQQNRPSYMYQHPSMQDDSVEALTAYFDNMTCGILSVMDGPSENPWRNLIWPLARQSLALYHAVAAMAAFHWSSDRPLLRIKGAEHKQASIKYVREGIRDNSISDEIAIATALALGFSESWDHHTATGNTHIKGAQVLVSRAVERHRQHPLKGVELARLKFLCNAWVYMDVIARFTSFDNDDSNDFDKTFDFTSDTSLRTMTNGADGFGIDFGMPIDARLDPLMGCANTLFPLIGRVANLVRKVWRSQTNSAAVISQANDLKTLLETWEPPAYIERPEDPSTHVQHTLQTAEAYRWATLLHLHQSVPEIPSIDSSELSQRVLRTLATVPTTSRTMIVHIFPLMAAGPEAKTAEDRTWVMQRWESMGKRMRIGVIDKCIAVTEEVWKRRAAYEAQPRSRGRVVATADLKPVRQSRDSPFGGASGNAGGSGGGGPRRLNEYLPNNGNNNNNADPGRTGMVFSYVDIDSEGQMLPHHRRVNFPEQRIGPMDVAYSVRGHLHWVGVMWDWKWEILLG